MKIQEIYDDVEQNLKKVINYKEKALMYTKSTKHGDFSLHESQILEGNVDLVLEQFKSNFISEVSYDSRVIYFKVEKSPLIKRMITDLISEKENFGKKPENGIKMVVEYSSPNIAKKFHPGHLRTTILGSFISNLLKIHGYSVHRINYLGDWGKQFGLLGVGFQKYGSEEELVKDPIKHLFDVYVKTSKEGEANPELDLKAKKWFTDLENGNQAHRKVWERFLNFSVEKYKEMYKILNVEFDEYSGESFYSEKAKSALTKFEGIIITDKDNSKYAETKHGKLVLLKNDGSTLYATRDLAVVIDRLERLSPIKMIYVVASEQDAYFKKLFDVCRQANIAVCQKDNEMLPNGNSDKFMLQHVNYGLVKGMSTRKGTVVFLEDIINEAKEVMMTKMKANTSKFEQVKNPEKTCEILAVTSLIIQDFSAKRIMDYVFNINKCTDTTGFGGPYLQYMHCRLCSIEFKNMKTIDDIYLKNTTEACNTGISNLSIKPVDKLEKIVYLADFSKLDSELHEITFSLIKYPHVLDLALENYEPSRIVTYLKELAQSLGGIINKYRVLDENIPIDVQLARICFYRAARIVIGNGLYILGITPLKRM